MCPLLCQLLIMMSRLMLLCMAVPYIDIYLWFPMVKVEENGLKKGLPQCSLVSSKNYNNNNNSFYL